MLKAVFTSIRIVLPLPPGGTRRIPRCGLQLNGRSPGASGNRNCVHHACSGPNDGYVPEDCCCQYGITSDVRPNTGPLTVCFDLAAANPTRLRELSRPGNREDFDTFPETADWCGHRVPRTRTGSAETFVPIRCGLSIRQLSHPTHRVSERGHRGRNSQSELWSTRRRTAQSVSAGSFSFSTFDEFGPAFMSGIDDLSLVPTG